MTTTSTPTDYSSKQAIQQAEERRAERVRMNNAAQHALEAQQKAAQEPRKRAKARAEEAAIVAIETLGVHDPLPDAPEFNGLRTARENIHKSVVSTFEAMARTFDNELLSGPQGIAQVARIGNETLAQHTDTINGLRNSLHRTRGDVEERLRAAMTPPPHLAGMVEQARDVLRAMKTEDREALIARARGDEALIIDYAIGGAPAFLTGSQVGQQMQKRTTLLGLRDPKLLQLEPGLTKAFAVVDKLEAGIPKLMNSVVDFDAAQALSDLRKA
ncbi:hypothetical protein MQC88_03215 [Luteimonas sp. 50]|uniref:Uncharacterized protein n=1 Tax=Cognatiluteimonas sedimenti TaxID=2927791 RepID=A0ABT0A210_9GAMM|nr:hypothetical protein [Lysobacter sedimenti]MCJ0824978.1 hypothetical protein [Lysobacter sedimenti]